MKTNTLKFKLIFLSEEEVLISNIACIKELTLFQGDGKRCFQILIFRTKFQSQIFIRSNYRKKLSFSLKVAVSSNIYAANLTINKFFINSFQILQEQKKELL